MMKLKKSNNKGFTLVELIVVLVILAILAAILVPALLGYIDRAKEQQIVLNARSVYTAAQAELSSMYGKDVPGTGLADKSVSACNICKTADVYTADNVAQCKITVAGDSGHAANTVKNVLYGEKVNGTYKYIYFDGKSWEPAEEGKTLVGEPITTGWFSLNEASHKN